MGGGGRGFGFHMRKTIVLARQSIVVNQKRVSKALAVVVEEP